MSLICGLNRPRAAASHPLLKYHTPLSPGEACAPSREYGRGGRRIYRGRRGSGRPTTCGGVIKSSDVRWAEVLFLPVSASVSGSKKWVSSTGIKSTLRHPGFKLRTCEQLRAESNGQLFGSFAPAAAMQNEKSAKHFSFIYIFRISCSSSVKFFNSS